MLRDRGRAIVGYFLIAAIFGPAFLAGKAGAVELSGRIQPAHVRGTLLPVDSICSEATNESRPRRIRFEDGGRYRAEVEIASVWRMEVRAGGRIVSRVIPPLPYSHRLPPLELPDLVSKRLRAVSASTAGIPDARAVVPGINLGHGYVLAPSSSTTDLEPAEGSGEARPEARETYALRIIDEEGRGLENAIVWLKGQPECYGRSSADGQVQLALEEPGELIVGAPGFELLRVDTALRESGAGIRLPRARGVLTARIVDPEDRPVEDVSVLWGEGDRRAFTDEDGTFSIFALPWSLSVELELVKSGYVPATVHLTSRDKTVADQHRPTRRLYLETNSPAESWTHEGIPPRLTWFSPGMTARARRP